MKKVEYIILVNIIPLLKCPLFQEVAESTAVAFDSIFCGGANKTVFQFCHHKTLVMSIFSQVLNAVVF